MPILYVHGVNTRSRDGFLAIEPILRRLVAPAVFPDAPESVRIADYYWGGSGIRLAWDGASRPRTRLRGKGFEDGRSPELVERSLAADEFRVSMTALPTAPAVETEDLLASKGGSGDSATLSMPDLTRLTSNQLSDLLSGLVSAELSPDKTSDLAWAKIVLAADEVARDPDTPVALAGQPPARHLEILLRRLDEKLKTEEELAAKGFSDSLAALVDRAGEALSRGLGLPGSVASTLAAEARPALNDFVSNFLLDVFVFLHDRTKSESKYNAIAEGLLIELAKVRAESMSDEPLVVLSHSMGGQLVWEAITSHLPHRQDLAGLRVDFWCATASQIGFFEEAKLFSASVPENKPGQPVPFPRRHLGTWWNVWDPNDILSFTARDIIAGVDDEPYNSGSSLLKAHGAYLERPSFYRTFAEKIEAARLTGFNTP